MSEEKKHIDEATGVETTGHEWDGIRELDNPLPRWWLWVFWATILWSLVYWVLMPSWPGVAGYARGLLDYSNRGAFLERMDAARAAQSAWLERIDAASLNCLAGITTSPPGTRRTTFVAVMTAMVPSTSPKRTCWPAEYVCRR